MCLYRHTCRHQQKWKKRSIYIYRSDGKSILTLMVMLFYVADVSDEGALERH